MLTALIVIVVIAVVASIPVERDAREALSVRFVGSAFNGTLGPFPPSITLEANGKSLKINIPNQVKLGSELTLEAVFQDWTERKELFLPSQAPFDVTTFTNHTAPQLRYGVSLDVYGRWTFTIAMYVCDESIVWTGPIPRPSTCIYVFHELFFLKFPQPSSGVVQEISDSVETPWAIP